jgi:hypothetical protein
MKVQATVLVGFQAKTLEEAGALLDEILRRARATTSTSAASSSPARLAITSSPSRRSHLR